MRKYQKQKARLQEDLLREDLQPADRQNKIDQLQRLNEKLEHFNSSQQMLL